MAYTKLSGKDFQKAHLALCEKRRLQTTWTPRTPKCHTAKQWSNVAEAILAAVGILLGMALLLWAAETGLARGAGWHVGNYADAPAWNDNL